MRSSPISGEEQEVYEAVLSSWLGKGQAQQLVNQRLNPPPSLSSAEIQTCAKGATFRPATTDGKGGKSLVGAKFGRSDIVLIDQADWKPADPAAGIARGLSVEAAVAEGFSHSLISFSEITFSTDHKDALVEFGSVCGRLCGSGSMLHLRKTALHWTVLNRCGEWIS
jgi:hypothetical protein